MSNTPRDLREISFYVTELFIKEVSSGAHLELAGDASDGFGVGPHGEV